MKIKNSDQQNISFVKKIFFGVTFFFFILFILEFVLGFVELEKHDHLFMPKSSYPIFIEGQGDQTGFYVTSSHFKEYINWQTFPRKKNQGNHSTQ